jgi:hypothetical protein
MPVILRSAEEVDRWLEADTSDALALQRPLPDEALRIVRRGENEDAPSKWLSKVESRNDPFPRLRTSTATIRYGRFDVETGQADWV